MNIFTYNKSTKILQPGKYIIVDPCYVIPNNEWGAFCDKVFENHEMFSVVYKEQYEIYAWSTAYGDGVYPVTHIGSVVGTCPVDAGLLSVIPIEALDVLDKLKFADLLKLSTTIEIGEETKISECDGNVDIGEYCINTTGNDDDDDSEY